jgi:IMP dehydrogenase
MEPSDYIEKESTPLLNTNRTNMNSIHNEIKKIRHQESHQNIFDEDDDCVVQDYPSYKELKERFEAQKHELKNYPIIETLNDSIQVDLSTTVDIDEILEEVNLDEMPNVANISDDFGSIKEEVIDVNLDEEDDYNKRLAKIDSESAQLIAQIMEMIDPPNIYSNYNSLYDGTRTDLLADKGLTFNDVNLLPTAFINFSRSDIKMDTQFTKNIRLKIPIVSSPMDTITEDKMAIKMALLGGIGVIHCNNTPEEQATMVSKVKKYTHGLVMDPVAFAPNDSIELVLEIKLVNGYIFNSFPVTVNGKSNGMLIGLITKRDIDAAYEISNIEKKPLYEIKVKDVMRPKTQLVYLKDTFDIDIIRRTLVEYRITKLPIVVKERVVAMACRTDIIHMQKYPNASLHPETKKLLVAAAISTGNGFNKRVDMLAKAGVDAIVIDSSQGCSQYQLNCLLYIKEFYPKIDVVCGNVATKFQTQILHLAGADAIRVGMGTGSICTTQNVTGVGRTQLSAIINAYAGIKKMTTQSNVSGCVGHQSNTLNHMYREKIPIIADGGIKSSGDIVKALAAGANTVMLGSLLAGTDETPGVIEERPNGYKVKIYRGMGSLAAMQNIFTDRFLSDGKYVIQGVSGEVIAKGPLQPHLESIIDSVKCGFINVGIDSVDIICELNEKNKIRWEQITVAGFNEGNVHSLHHYQY